MAKVDNRRYMVVTRDTPIYTSKYRGDDNASWILPAGTVGHTTAHCQQPVRFVPLESLISDSGLHITSLLLSGETLKECQPPATVQSDQLPFFEGCSKERTCTPTKPN